MAKFGSYYGLCPLIDQKSILGVNEDSEVGHVIVTLGKNIAIKFRFSDQKQIQSWRTKDKFSSAVVYDKDSKNYVAVFNQMYTRVWKEDEDSLDKLKKYKFSKPLHMVVKSNGKSFVVFKNGCVVPFSFALENYKTFEEQGPLTERQQIEDVLTATFSDKTCIALQISEGDKKIFLWTIFDKDEKVENRVEISRPNLNLAGCVLHSDEQNLHLLTLWSDGKLYSYPLISASENTSTMDPPGHTFSIIESISCKSPVTMTALNEHYLAMYGADSNEEGAILMLYNTQFKVTQLIQPMKLFTSGGKLWNVQNYLLLCVGQNLAVVPYFLDTEQLEALVGSHRAALLNLDPDITIVEDLKEVNWNSGDSTEVDTSDSNKAIPNLIRAKVLEFARQGLAENNICMELIPNFVENEDTESLINCLEYFSDIPDICLAKLLQFCLSANSKLFKSADKIGSEIFPKALQPLERCQMLDKILMNPFSDVFLLPHIHNELDITSSLLLLQYICYLMSEDGHSLPAANISESENRLIEWGCLLLDANYQRFVVSKDEKIFETVSYYHKLVYEYLDSLKSINCIAPLVREFSRKGAEFSQQKQVANLKYSVEQLSLY